MTTATQTRRIAFTAQLEPMLGSTFQPTGFPDLGAATFSRPLPGGRDQRCLIVESTQSMANRLEATGWDGAANRPIDAFQGLPYIEVVSSDGHYLTSSRTEAHRLFSAYIRDAIWENASGDSVLLDKLGIHADTPLDYPAMAKAIVALDPLSLLHGVFFAGQSKAKKTRAAWPAQPRITRAVSAVIEAHDIREVASGGRKADSVRHSLGEESGETGGTAEGYGSVPFHRMEYTAGTITASFVVDTQLIASYGLPEPTTKLLETLALWEIRQLLDGGLRLRTACDLALIDGSLTSRTGHTLPTVEELEGELRSAISGSSTSLGEGKAITVQWSLQKAAK